MFAPHRGPVWLRTGGFPGGHASPAAPHPRGAAGRDRDAGRRPDAARLGGEGARRGARDALARRRPGADHGQLVRARARPRDAASARSSTPPTRTPTRSGAGAAWTGPSRRSSSAGMKPMLDVAFFAPRWAVERGARDGDHRWRPSAPDFGQFAEALARRYNGGYEDPVDKGSELPAVRLWTTWNEPNHASFLLPQWERTPRAAARLEARLAAHLPARCTRPGYAAIKKVNDQQPGAARRHLLLRRHAGRGRAGTSRRCASCASWPASTGASARFGARVPRLPPAPGRRLRPPPLLATATARARPIPTRTTCGSRDLPRLSVDARRARAPRPHRRSRSRST